jgi:hypothetical protein
MLKKTNYHGNITFFIEIDIFFPTKTITKYYLTKFMVKLIRSKTIFVMTCVWYMNCLRSSLSILKLDKFLFLFYRVENVMVLEEGQSPLISKYGAKCVSKFLYLQLAYKILMIIQDGCKTNNAQNQNNVSEWSDMSTCGLLFQ